MLGEVHAHMRPGSSHVCVDREDFDVSERLEGGKSPRADVQVGGGKTPAWSSAIVTGQTTLSSGSAAASIARAVSRAMNTLVSSSPRAGGGISESG